ncbi:MAG: peptidylprolyl isomerase [Rhodocyclaceae bacterium]|nr:peptidylprolyl isomerase [Rhodocyclaceae bacterium]
MLEAVRNNRKIVQIFLVLITIPFALFGVDAFIRNAGSADEAATVGGATISRLEFQQALREQQERAQAQFGGRLDPAMLDNPELRRAVLESLVNQKVFSLAAAKANLRLSDNQLAEFIAADPELQEEGRFSPRKYDALVASRGKSRQAFEASLRQDIIFQQVMMPVANGVLPGKTASNQWLGIQLEERDVSELVLKPEVYVAQVKIPAEAVKTYYETNRKQFETPEQVRVEYLVLSLDAISQAEQVSADEVRKAYESANGSAVKEREAARQKAEQLLAEVRKDPKRFADLAQKNSQDPGSKDKGGDLGFFGRGAMVKPFEDAVFKMKVGDVGPIVESDFGFHIITLNEVRKGTGGEERRASHILLSKPAGAKSFESERKEIEANLKRQAAQRKFAEMSEGFTNTVYEQADSLKPAAEKFHLAVQQSGWISRVAPPPQFANAKLLSALFSDDAIKNKRNTDAIEVAPNTLLAARVVEHKEAALQPLESVKGAIEKQLARVEGGKLAAKDGADKLERLKKGESISVSWGTPRSLSRVQAGSMAPELARAMFGASADKLPTYAGLEIPGGGYMLLRITKVKPYQAGSSDDGRVATVSQQYARLIAEQEFGAWLAAARARYEVKINKAMLENKDKQ